MRTSRFRLFRRILVLVFLLIGLLSALFMALTYASATHFEQAGTQLLNKDVAAHIATFASPFGTGSFDRQKADSVFYQAMVMSPGVEVYFLDSTGKVLYYHGSPEEIKNFQVDLSPVGTYLAEEGKQYVRGTDPRDPGATKVFSAAKVLSAGRSQGYIYVILGGRAYRQVIGSLFRSTAGELLLRIFAVVLLSAIALSIFYVSRLRRHFNRMIGVLQQFEAGDYQARFPVIKNDDLAPVTTAFNKMAGLLDFHIQALQATATERKEFTANISHDLRTPLAVARGYAETLMLPAGKTAMTTAAAEEYLRLIVTNLQAVEHMVGQLLEISRLESANLLPSREPFVFSEIVQELVHSATLSAAGNSVRIDCDNCEETSWIVADIHLMERVVQNLLGNAIKFAPAGGTVRVRFERAAEGDLVFSIANDGGPLPEGLTDWLNENNHTLKRPPTRGLGLVIVKTILQLHRFPLSVSNDPAAGVVFTVRLTTFQPPLPAQL